MPSKTKKQANFMRLCASSQGRKKAKGKCPPRDVAVDFTKADKKKNDKAWTYD